MISRTAGTSTFQLLTITALYTAIKINEKVVISSDLLANLCNRFYTAEEIEDMESILLSGLSWRCHAPTAHQVGMTILSLLLPYVDMPEERWGFLMDDMKYLTELTVRDYYFSTRRASTVALAAILNVVSDTTTKQRRQLIKGLLRIIIESFDFDDARMIAEARARLRFLTDDDTVDDDFEMGERSLGLEERSLEESVKTYKISNCSPLVKRARH